MRSHVRWFAIAALLAGCKVEGGSPPGREGGGAERPPASPHTFAIPSDTAAPAERQVFDRTTDTVVAGVRRLTINAIIRAERGKDAARAAMRALVDEARRQDSGLAAIRVLAYLPPSPGGPPNASLQPLGYVDWVPVGGWDSLRVETARLAHRYTFVFLADLSPHAIPSTP